MPTTKVGRTSLVISCSKTNFKRKYDEVSFPNLPRSSTSARTAYVHKFREKRHADAAIEIKVTNNSVKQLRFNFLVETFELV